ncbi:hypothetical protein UT300002_20280 [Clostridium perfringens]
MFYTLFIYINNMLNEKYFMFLKYKIAQNKDKCRIVTERILRGEFYGRFIRKDFNCRR